LPYKGKGIRLSAFKGSGSKLNRAIFEALAFKGPSTVYEIYKYVRKKTIFRRKLYSVINRRVKGLVRKGYLSCVGRRKTKAGFMAPVYALTSKAYLAILLYELNLEELLEKLSEAEAMQLMAFLLSSNMSVF